MNKCDNITQLHEPVITGETERAIGVYCKQCDNYWRVGKDHNGAPEKELWSELFFSDNVQQPHPLFYKLHPEHLNVV